MIANLKEPRPSILNVWYFISPHKTDEDFNLFQGKHRYQRTIKNKIKKKKKENYNLFRWDAVPNPLYTM